MSHAGIFDFLRLVSAGTFSGNSKCASKTAAELDTKYEKQVMDGDGVNNSMDPLEWMLNEVVGSLQPTEDDYLRRQYVIHHLSDLVQSLDICKGHNNRLPPQIS